MMMIVVVLFAAAVAAAVLFVGVDSCTINDYYFADFFDKGGKRVLEYYKSSPKKALQELFPNLEFTTTTKPTTQKPTTTTPIKPTKTTPTLPIPTPEPTTKPLPHGT